VSVDVKTLGALGEEAVEFISQLGHHIAAMTGEWRSTALLFQLSLSRELNTIASMTTGQIPRSIERISSYEK